MQTTRIGFIGLGNMGLGMASNLARKGFEVTACDLRREPFEIVKQLGAKEARSPKEVARTNNVVISVVRGTAQTDKVMLGPEGILENLSKGSIIIICSTLGPSYVYRLAVEAERKGIGVLDAPVSGGDIGSEAGTLTFMVGGEENALRTCLPIFQAMGKNVFHLGGTGTGQVCKLVNNITMSITSHAVSEGVAFGLKAGLRLDRMLEVLKVSTGNSWVAEHYAHMVLTRKKWQREEIESFSNYTKDLDLALAYARELRISLLPIIGLISQLDKGTLFPEEDQH